MTQISVDAIKARHEELSEKVGQAKSSKDVIQEVKAFIIEIRAAGAMTPPGNKRELLRSLADAWGNYIYRETGIFPPTELDTYAGPERHMLALPPWIASLSRPGQILLLVGVILIVMIISSWVSSSIAASSAKATQIAESSAEKTKVALAVEQTAQAVQVTTETAIVEVPLDTETPTLTATPTLTPSPTETPSPTLGLIPPLGAETESAGILVQITNLKGSESVPPEMALNGTYENLPAGWDWSIHVMLEPLSNVGTLYPLGTFYTIPQGETNGMWSLNIRFDTGAGIASEERFLISLLAAQDDRARSVLKSAVGRGLTQLPAGVISFPGVTSVTRKAYALIHEERLIFTSYLNETNNSEILAAKLDGSDVQQIPNPDRYVSLQTSISPNGDRIVYVGQERAGDEIFYLLILMDSNGSNRNTILRQKGVIERPLWSRDGKFIAYSAITPTLSQLNTQSNIFSIFVYDVENDVPYQLTFGEPSDRYPAWMSDGKRLVFNSRTAGTNTIGLLTIELNTGEINTLLDMSILDEEQASVSPDGNLIAYSASSSSDPADNSDIYIFDTRDQKITQLTGINSDDGHDIWPTWSSDGNTIYFQSHRSGQRGTSPNIWAIDLDGNNLRQITFGLESDTAPFVGVLNAYWPIGE